MSVSQAKEETPRKVNIPFFCHPFLFADRRLPYCASSCFHCNACQINIVNYFVNEMYYVKSCQQFESRLFCCLKTACVR